MYAPSELFMPKSDLLQTIRVDPKAKQDHDGRTLCAERCLSVACEHFAGTPHPCVLWDLYRMTAYCSQWPR